MRKIVMIVVLSLLMMSCQQETESPADINQVPTQNEAANERDNETAEEISDEETNEDEDQASSQETKEEKPVAENKRVQVAVDALKLRVKSTVVSDQIGSVFYGSVYEVLDEKRFSEDEYWYQVEADGQIGWIAGWFCQETDLEEQGFERDECERLSLDSFYTRGTSFNKADLVEDTETLLYLDGKLVDDLFILNDIREYQLYTVQDNKRSPIVNLQVMPDKIYGFLYEMQDEKSKRVSFVRDFDDINEKVVSVILKYTDQLEIWYEIETDQKPSYLKVAFEDHDKRDNTYKVITNQESFTYDIKGWMIDEVFYGQYVIFEDWTNTLLNIKTGQLFTSQYSFHLLDESHLAVYPTSDFQHRGQAVRLGKIQIIDLESDFDVVYEFERLVSTIRAKNNLGDFLDEIEINSQSSNTWVFADNQHMKEYGVFEKFDGKWQLTTRSDIPDFVDTEVTVYSSYNDLTSEVGQVMLSDVVIENIRLIDIIDDQFAYWFRVSSEDIQGFVYRPKHDYEDDHYYPWIDYSLVMNGDKLYKEEIVGDENLAFRTVSDMFAKHNLYTLEYSYEGNYIKVIDKNEKDIFGRVDSEFFPFDNQNRVLVMTVPYGADFSAVGIYRIENGAFIEELLIEEDHIRVSDLKIKDDKTITFTITNEGSFPVTLKLVDGKWLVETDYQFIGRNE